MLRSLLALTVLLAATSCAGPTSPSPGLPPPSLSTFQAASPVVSVPVTAEITMTSVAPASGATITVRDCETEGGTGWARLCSHDFRGTFSVQANGELQNLVLTVSFWDGERRCGYAADKRDALAAETSASFAPSLTFLSWEEFSPPPTTVNLFQPCSLPITTTRLIAELWTQHDHRSILTREFPGTYTYTFIRR